jgi:hypothetical protein
MKQTLDSIIAQFAANLRAVDALLRFDEALLGYGLHTLQEVDTRLKENGFDNPRYRITKAIGMLERVRETESIKALYGVMYNQCIVLQVSYFASSLKSVFTDCLVTAITSGATKGRLQKETIEISLAELADLEFELAEHVGELVANKADISFQDMQSIGRAFTTYFGVTLPRDENVDNIIYAQACRNCIVHSGAVADARLLRQIAAASRRTIDVQLKEGASFSFSPDSIQRISQSMSAYVDLLAKELLVTLQ